MAVNPQNGKRLVKSSTDQNERWFRVEQAIRFGGAVCVAGWAAPVADVLLWSGDQALETAIVRRARGDVARGLRLGNPDDLGFVAFAWATGDVAISISGQEDPKFLLTCQDIAEAGAGALQLRPNERRVVAQVMPKGSREQALVLGHVRSMTDDIEGLSGGEPRRSETGDERAKRPAEEYLDLDYLATQARAADLLSWTPAPKADQDLADWYFDNWRSTEIDPRREFSVRFYLESNPDIREGDVDPLLHYVMHGHAEGRRPHPLIFSDFVSKQHGVEAKDVASFFSLFNEEVWLNPLMRKKERLAEVERLLEDKTADASELFTFDYKAWLSRQTDVLEVYPRHPVYHLFEYGMAESRLSVSDGIDRRLLFNGGTGRGSDLDALRTLNSPVAVTTFKQVAPAKLEPAQCDSRICIGIVYYKNSAQEITRMANSIAMQGIAQPDELEVLLMDNSPQPIEGLLEAYEAVGLRATLHGDGTNIGFGPGHNSLMEIGFADGASHYFGLNPDGFLLPDAVRFALADSARRSHGALIEMDAFPIGHPKWWNPFDGTTSWVSGAAFVCPKDVFTATGGFDPDFPLYGEDVDWSLRCRMEGIPTVVSGQARFFHDITPRLGVEDIQRETNSLYGNWYLLKKWGANERAMTVKNRLMALGVTEFPEVKQVEKVPNAILEDLELPRYAYSRFWE